MGFRQQFIAEAAAYDLFKQHYLPKFLELAPEGLEPILRAGSVEKDLLGFVSSILMLDPTTPFGLMEDFYAQKGTVPFGKYGKQLLSWFLSDLRSKLGSRTDSLGYWTAIDTLISYYRGLRDPIKQYDSIVPYLTGKERSITAFRTVEDFLGFMAGSEKLVADAMEKKAAKSVKVPYEDPTYRIVIPQTHEASAYYGKGTNWCTTWENDANYFNQYSKDGILLMILHREDTTKSYQLFVSKGGRKEEMAANHKDAYANLEIALSGTDVLEWLKDNVEDALHNSSEIWAREVHDGARQVERYDRQDEYPYTGDLLDDEDGGEDDEDEDEDEDENIYDGWSAVIEWDTSAEPGPYKPWEHSDITIPSQVIKLEPKIMGYNDELEPVDLVGIPECSLTMRAFELDLRLLDESCYAFPKVNFASRGLVVTVDVRMGTPVALVQYVNSSLQELAEEYGYFPDEVSSSEYISSIRELMGGIEQQDCGFVIFVFPADNGFYGWADDDMVNWSSFLAQALPAGVYATWGDRATGDLAIGGKSYKVAIEYDVDYGDLSDALADPAFQKQMESGFHPDAAAAAGQRELEFSSRRVR